MIKHKNRDALSLSRYYHGDRRPVRLRAPIKDREAIFGVNLKSYGISPSKGNK